MRSFIFFVILDNLLISCDAILFAGIPVIIEMTSATCSSVTVSLFDFRSFSDGYVANVDDIKRELDRIEHTISPLDIVFINTAASGHYGKPDFLLKGCGIGKEATIYLLDQGVRLTGTDAWSWDAPFSHTAKRYAESKDSSIIWEGHRAGMERAYCHIEKLGSLEKLPDFGFLVSCFPFKIKKASAGFIRAVAILEE